MKFTDQLGRDTFTTNVNLRLKIFSNWEIGGQKLSKQFLFCIMGVKKILFVVDIKNSSQQVKGNLQCSRDEHCKGDSAFSHDIMAAILVF